MGKDVELADGSLNDRWQSCSKRDVERQKI